MEIISYYTCTKLSDKQIYKILNDLCQEFQTNQALIYLGNQPLDIIKGQANDLSKSSGNLISRADFFSNANQFGILIRKGLGHNIIEGSQISNVDQGRKSSPYFDEVYICVNENNRPNLSVLQKCDAILSKYAGKYISDNKDGANDAVSILKNEMALLADQYREMMAGLDLRRKQIEDDNQRISAARSTEHQKQLAEIDAHRKKELERIAIAQEELDASKKELHDKHHMHERRELRKKITDDVKSRLERSIVSPRSKILRQGVTIISSSISFFLGILAYYSLHEFSNKIGLPTELIPAKQTDGGASAYMGELRPSDPFLWALMARGILASLGCVGFAIYTISWLRNLYISDVAVQRNLENFSSDMNRASWVIETIMEMNSQQQANPPEAWIQGVCSNLFEANEKKKSNISETNALGAILGASVKAKLGANGAEFEFDKKGTSKLAKVIE